MGLGGEGKEGKRKRGERRGQVHVSWLSWGDGGRVEVLMCRASPMDQHGLVGVCEEGLLLVLLAPSAFAQEIQARCKQHDSPWKHFPAGHKGMKAKSARYCPGLGRKNTQLPFHWALPGPAWLDTQSQVGFLQKTREAQHGNPVALFTSAT